MRIVFILVEPAVPENIGATARALNTMGFSELRIVNPKVELTGKAQIVAHGSLDVLKNAVQYPQLSDAIADLDFVIATSAKKRRTNENYLPARKLSEFLKKKDKYIQDVGIVFGREESGLSNHEISQSDLVSYIPLKKAYPSLNLSHAVMIFAYEMSNLRSEKQINKEIDATSLKNLKRKVKEILEKNDIKQPHIILPRVMERLSYLDNNDLGLFHAAISALTDDKRY